MEQSIWPMVVAGAGSLISAMALLILTLVRHSYEQDKKSREEKDKAHEERLTHLERTQADVERAQRDRHDQMKDKIHAMELAEVKQTAQLDALSKDHDDVSETLKDLRAEFNTRMGTFEEMLRKSLSGPPRPETSYRRHETPPPMSTSSRDPRDPQRR